MALRPRKCNMKIAIEFTGPNWAFRRRLDLFTLLDNLRLGDARLDLRGRVYDSLPPEAYGPGSFVGDGPDAE